jgi:hypothetical protein
MGLSLKILHAGSLISAEYIRIATLYRTLNFAKFSKHWSPIVFCRAAVAEEQVIVRDNVFQALQTLSSVITKVAGCPAFLVLSVAPKACHSIGTFTVPSILA